MKGAHEGYLGKNSALQFTDSPAVDLKLAAKLIEFQNYGVELFQQSLQLLLHPFPNWPRFFESCVNAFFEESQTLVKRGDVFRNCRLLGADLNDIATYLSDVLPQRGQFRAHGGEFATHLTS